MHRILLIAALLSVASCVRFQDCKQDPGEVIGRLNADLDVTRLHVRTVPTAMGQIVADSMIWVLQHSTSHQYLSQQNGVVALINAGAIRQETRCGKRDFLQRGEITTTDVINLLPFDDQIVAVRLYGRDLKLLLERGTSKLKSTVHLSAPGHFLHVAGLQAEIDCDQASQTLAADHTRIVHAGNRVQNLVIAHPDHMRTVNPTTQYWVIMPQYMASGSDGFLAMAQRDRDNRVIFDTKGALLLRVKEPRDIVIDDRGHPWRVRDAVMAYIKDHEGTSLPLPEHTNPRLLLNANCNL